MRDIEHISESKMAAATILDVMELPKNKNYTTL